jgi:hypothetical protein
MTSSLISLSSCLTPCSMFRSNSLLAFYRGSSLTKIAQITLTMVPSDTSLDTRSLMGSMTGEGSSTRMVTIAIGGSMRRIRSFSKELSASSISTATL